MVQPTAKALRAICAESDMYAVTDSVKEAVHIKLLCEEAGIQPPGIPLAVWEDHIACVHLGHGLKSSKAAKHFSNPAQPLSRSFSSSL